MGQHSATGTHADRHPTSRIVSGLDPLGAVLAALLAVGLLALPLVIARPNRIAEGSALTAWSALPAGQALALLAVSAFALPALAHEFKAGSLEIEHPWTRVTPAGAKVGRSSVLKASAATSSKPTSRVRR